MVTRVSAHWRDPMRRARFAIAVVGIVLPYVARVPGSFVHGTHWLTSYFAGGIPGFLFIGSFNGLAWGSIVALTFFVRKPSPLLIPALGGFGFLAYAHSELDLAGDAQAGVALAFIPIFALPIIGITFMLSVGILGRGPLSTVTSVREGRVEDHPTSP